MIHHLFIPGTFDDLLTWFNYRLQLPLAWLSSKDETIYFIVESNWPTNEHQDLYPTYLQVTKAFTLHNATIATIIGSCVSLEAFIIAKNTDA